ncbi:MAG: hypothetical protein F6K04_26555, partial [Leptolyngbya sp. SIO4C5]|nr:hypothetical protein [Leptolyngbya sp. SIO4C5]
MSSHKQQVLISLKAVLVQEKEQSSLKRSQRSQYIAAINWLQRYSPKHSSEKIDLVRGELEAFYHLCAVSD